MLWSTRPWSAVFLYLLAFLVGASLIQSLVPLVPIHPLDEHRLPEPPPNFALLRNGDGAAFADALNRWADDRVGFRELLIRLKNQIDFSVFGVSRKIYIGSDGWLFDRDNANARAELERLDAEGFAKLQKSFVDLAEFLRRRDVALIVVGYVDKSIFYSEYLPSDAPRFPKSGRLGQLWHFLKHSGEFAFIDAAALLNSHRADGPLYQKTDIHPNLLGGVPVVKEIVRTIAARERRPDVAWNEHFDFKSGSSSTGVENLRLATMHPAAEEVFGASNLYAIGKDNAFGSWRSDPRRITYPNGVSAPIFDWEFVSRPGTCDSRLPAAALFGDSFSDLYWSLGIQNYFCSLRRARTDMQRLPPYLNDLPPETRYFIFEFASTFLPGQEPRITASRIE
jgi:alginate O-acetyltransferase complex protein AlgJ